MHNRKKDEEKTGVSKFADMIQKKGMNAIHKINQIPTPTSLKEIQTRFQKKPQTHDIQTFANNLYKTTGNNHGNEYDEVEEDVENQMEGIKNRANQFVERQKEERVQELNQIQSAGKVQNLIKQASGKITGIIQSATNIPNTPKTPKTPKTTVTSDINISNITNETKKNVKSNVMNIIHKAKNTLETEVENIGNQIERDIEMSQIENQENQEDQKDNDD
jgi:hypothetical protein